MNTNPTLDAIENIRISPRAAYGKIQQLQSDLTDMTKDRDSHSKIRHRHLVKLGKIYRNEEKLFSDLIEAQQAIQQKDELIFSYDAVRSPVVDKTITQLQSDLTESRNAEEMSSGCFAMIAEALEKVGCCHGHDIKSTPPMSYDDMIYCAVGKRELEIKGLKQTLTESEKECKLNASAVVAKDKIIDELVEAWESIKQLLKKAKVG